MDVKIAEKEAVAAVHNWRLEIDDIRHKRIGARIMENKILVMAIFMLIVLIVGTASDFTPTVLILTAVLMPIVKQGGIDLVYFGVLFIMNSAIGLVTPPVGAVLNVVCGVARVPMTGVIKGAFPS